MRQAGKRTKLIENVKRRHHLEYLGINRKVIIKLILKCGGKLHIKLIWLRIVTGGGLL
jgi:hypothetical protein